MTPQLLKRERVLVVVAVPMTVKAFLLPYLKALGTQHDVTVACAEGDGSIRNYLPEGVRFEQLDICRAISLIDDFRALLALVRMIRVGHYAMVHSVTPKAGLLAMLAARWCRVSIRLHMFTGQVWVTRTGLFRLMLKKLDCLVAACATNLLADSGSQRAFLVEEGVADAGKIEVLGQGSICGVDTARFHTDLVKRGQMRRHIGLAEGDVVALFVGRLSRDKGVLDLIKAFLLVAEQLPELVLLLVGPDEEGLGAEIDELRGKNARLHMLGGTAVPEEYMMAGDFFCLPSYREGFGSVVIEAAACGLPAICSDVYGLTDAVENGKSGFLHPVRDVKAIAALLERFSRDRSVREAMGEYARQRALTVFPTHAVVAAQLTFVNALLRGGTGEERKVAALS